MLFIIALGQVLSLCLCGTGVFSQLLENKYNIKTPTTQSFFNYLLLALIFLSRLIYKGQFLQILRDRGWKYFVLGLIDVEANYLVVKAYQYTNLTSIQVRYLSRYQLKDITILLDEAEHDVRNYWLRLSMI